MWTYIYIYNCRQLNISFPQDIYWITEVTAQLVIVTENYTTEQHFWPSSFPWPILKSLLVPLGGQHNILISVLPFCFSAHPTLYLHTHIHTHPHTHNYINSKGKITCRTFCSPFLSLSEIPYFHTSKDYSPYLIAVWCQRLYQLFEIYFYFLNTLNDILIRILKHRCVHVAIVFL